MTVRTWNELSIQWWLMNRKILGLIVVVVIAAPAMLLSYYATSQQYAGPPIPAHISTSSTDFAVDMYGQIAADLGHKDTNIFFSPFSIYTAFAFLYEGAGGQTASQMQDVFEFATDEQTRHEQMSQTMKSINRNDPQATLVIANALWLDKRFEPYLLAGYADIVRDTYTADIDTLDFKDSVNSAKRINDWASDSTSGKIKEVVDPTTVMGAAAILNNAIYFKGTWVMQFDPDETYKDSFWRQPEDPVRSNFMRTEASFNYTESDGIQILRMPYNGDRLSMLVFLPSEDVGIDGLEKMLSTHKIDEWRQDMQDVRVTAIIPKFTTNTHYELNNYFGLLGMQDAFNPEMADFSGMADLEKLKYLLYVSNATQDAFVDVNEEGTEAAAVTTIVLVAETGPDIKLFNANRPFIFAIQDDESGTILFMGRLSDPTA